MALTGTVTTNEPVEVACDESGSEGENLSGGETDVFAHASVRLDGEAAEHCIEEIRERIRSPALEYKSNHLLRKKHRSVLEWLLGPLGPIYGDAHVHLTDKTFLLVGRVVDLLFAEDIHEARLSLYQDRPARDMTATLYREGRTALGGDQWASFLGSSNDVLRVKNRRSERTSVDAFFRLVDALCAGTRSPVREILEQLRRARPRVELFRAQALDNPRLIPPLDPLIPAIVQAVIHWGEGGRAVSIVHDEQVSLTTARVAQLREIFSEPHPDLLRHASRGRLTGVRLVDSRSDARVQVADFLAGVARKIASEELNGRGDAGLTDLLRPYVDASSVWGDDRSWTRLGGRHGEAR